MQGMRINKIRSRILLHLHDLFPIVNEQVISILSVHVYHNALPLSGLLSLPKAQKALQFCFDAFLFVPVLVL